MIDVDLDQWFAVWIHDVDSAADAGVEAVDRSEDFQRLIGVVQMMPLQRLLVGTCHVVGISGTGIPQARYDALVVIDLEVFFRQGPERYYHRY